jgi:hypothetical protein
MTEITTDSKDPRLTWGVDDKPVAQAAAYLVLPQLPEEYRSKGYVRPFRDAYRHCTCGTVTTMGHALAETYAKDPTFYGATFCVNCSMHRPVAEFTWLPDGEVVGS